MFILLTRTNKEQSLQCIITSSLLQLTLVADEG